MILGAYTTVNLSKHFIVPSVPMSFDIKSTSKDNCLRGQHTTSKVRMLLTPKNKWRLNRITKHQKFWNEIWYWLQSGQNACKLSAVMIEVVCSSYVVNEAARAHEIWDALDRASGVHSRTPTAHVTAIHHFTLTCHQSYCQLSRRRKLDGYVPNCRFLNYVIFLMFKAMNLRNQDILDP